MPAEDNKPLESAAKLLGLIAAASLGMSLIYDWGFFSALNISFNELPTSIADHARTALDWAPFIAAMLIVASVYLLLTQRIEGGKTEQEIVGSSPNPEKVRKLRAAPDKFLRYIALASVGTFLLFGEHGASGLLVVGLLWIGFADWAQEHPRIVARRSWKVRAAITLVPAIAYFMWVTGRSEAIILYRAVPTSKVVLAGDKGSVDVTILRFFDKGMLVRETNVGIVFRQWATIDHVEMASSSYKPFPGILCTWFRLGCRETVVSGGTR